MTRVAMMPEWLEPPDLSGVRYVYWDSAQSWPDESVLAEVEFFVPPYMGSSADLEVMSLMPRLRIVQSLMAGIDGITSWVPPDTDVVRAVGLHDTSTAELAVGLMIASLRGIDEAARDMSHGRWNHVRRPSLADRTVGVVGWGGVGKAIAARLTGFEVEVIGFSRSGSDGAHSLVEFDELLSELDVVVLALPLSQSSRGFMSSARLARMRDGSLLVNVGRGALVNTPALVAELDRGRLRAALDVTDPEPPPPDHPLWRCPNLLITPHVGGDSGAFVPRARQLVARQVTRWASGEPLH
ncbi:MAG: NAD(P)-dependent oxidoreductase [Candidatus Nanopelagicales bacterium]